MLRQRWRARGLMTSGAAIVDYSTFAVAMDFDSADYNVSGTNYPLITSVPGYTFTRTGAVGFTNLAGGIDYFAANVPAINDRGYHAYGALTNLLLNAGSSAVLVTQTTPALTAVVHTISFIGTGSVALSGAFVGTLAGTGATNQVALTFTPTAAALTATVTGDVRFAGLMAANLSGAIPIIATGAATASIGASNLSQTGNPVTTDQDFIFYAVVNLTEVTSAVQFLASLGSTDANRISLIRDGGQPLVNKKVAGVNNLTFGITTGTGPLTVLYRRQAGKDSLHTRHAGVTTIGAETASATFPALDGFVGHGYWPSGPSAELRGEIDDVFVRQGTFTDAQITTLLEGL